MAPFNRLLLILRFGGRFFTIRSIILSVTGGFAREFELQDVSEQAFLPFKLLIVTVEPGLGGPQGRDKWPLNRGFVFAIY